MFREDIKKKGFGFFSVEEFIAVNNDSPEINTSNYFFIVCALEKSLRYTICGREHELPVNHVLYIGINKTFKVIDIQDDENLIIVFSSDFYERSLYDAQLLNSELFFRPDPYVSLIPIPISAMKKDVSYKLKTHRENNTGLDTIVIHNVIEMLITDGLTQLKSFPLKTIDDPVELEILNKFQILLQHHYKDEKQVTFYAERLYITPKQLSTIAEKITGKRAKEMIIEKVVQESLRLLRHSMFTISEISEKLGFDNDSNFSLFFKKHYGIPPSEYRHSFLKERAN